MGEKFKRFIYKDDLEKVEGYLKKVISGISKYVQYRTIGFKGEVNHIDVTLVPIRTNDDEVIGLYGLARNIYWKIIHDSEQVNLYRYGVEFIIDETDREHLIKQINQLQLQLNRKTLLEAHSFVTENVQVYFNKL